MKLTDLVELKIGYELKCFFFFVKDLMSCQAQLMEVCQQKQKLEETLRQRERELTALKGALKDEVANHDKEMEVLREQYSTDMEKLRNSMEQVSQVGGQLTTSSEDISHASHLCPLPVFSSAPVTVQIIKEQIGEI